MKKIISVIAACAMLTGCSAKNEHSEAVSAVENSVTSTTSTTSSASESSAESKTSSTASTSSSIKEKTPVSSTAVSSASTTSEKETSTAPVESAPAQSTVTSATSSSSVPAEEKPSWNEEPVNATMYVNTKGIYSRKDAIVGSKTVKLYGLNDKVTVVAATDTDYYKLEDGSFIHKDYLSDKETVIPEPVKDPQPSVSPKPSYGVSADIAQLLNNAPLNPMLTNESELDDLITDLLEQTITDDMSTAEKVRAVYDYIIRSYTYGRTKRQWYTESNYHLMLDSVITSAAATLIMEKQGVCTDYSSLFVVLTRRIGLESYYIEGTVKAKAGGMTGHAWTVIKLDGQYYIFDPQVEQDNLVNGKIMYNYFGKPESSMSSVYDHNGGLSLLEMCKWHYRGESFSTDNGRDFAIKMFGNFAVDEGERPYDWRFA